MADDHDLVHRHDGSQFIDLVCAHIKHEPVVGGFFDTPGKKLAFFRSNLFRIFYSEFLDQMQLIFVDQDACNAHGTDHRSFASFVDSSNLSSDLHG